MLPGLRIDLGVSGLERAEKIAAAVMKIGQVKVSAELNAMPHQPYDGNGKTVSNAVIAAGMAEEHGRDFTTPEADVVRAMDRKIQLDLERGIDKAGGIEKLQPVAVVKGKQIKFESRKAMQILARAYRNAMKIWNKATTENLKEGTWLGGGDDNLTPEYAKTKREAVGFERPIGTRSGQFLDNFAPSARNIKIVRGK